MQRLQIITVALLAVSLLQGCSQAPSRPALAVAPLLRIDDARATLAQQRTPTPSPPPPPSAAAAPATLPMTPSRMEIVQLGPNEYRLQYRQSTVAELATAPPTGRIQIVNGNGVRGMGERVRRLLARQGMGHARVVNQRGHYQRTTVIEYLPDQQASADAMLLALQGRAKLLPARTLPEGLALRLVLGRDNSAARIAALDAVPSVRLTAAVPHFNQE